MDEFTLQIKVLNYASIYKTLSNKEIVWNRVHKVFISILLGFFFYSLNHFIIVNYQDVYEGVECFAVIVTGIFTLIKYAFVLMYSDEIFEMMDEVKALNNKWKKTGHYYLIENANKLDKFVFRLMSGFAMSAGTVYIIMPLVKFAVKYALWQDSFQYELPFRTEFFYDITNPFAYVVSYLVQSIGCTYAVFLTIIMDTVFFGLCMNIAVHFKILKRTIHEMELKEFVEYHLNIVRMTTKLNDLYIVIIFAEYSLLSLMLCTTGFQIIMSHDLIIIFRSIFHGGAAIIDLLIYSYGGQIIMDCAGEICSDYYDVSKKYLIVMMRTKLDLKIESLMYHASLPTFSLIMGRSMSLITMLKSFA